MFQISQSFENNLIQKSDQNESLQFQQNNYLTQDFSQNQQIQKNNTSKINQSISSKIDQAAQCQNRYEQEQEINKIQEEIHEAQEIDKSDSEESQTVEQENSLCFQQNQTSHYYFLLEKSLLEIKNSAISFKYKDDTNQLIMEKTFLTELLSKNQQKKENQFSSEYQILEKLKGNKITMDIIQFDEDKLSFEQILGKTDLFRLQKKIKDRHIFELYFLILLDKLNKMHELNVAHSDIKPQNIVISYEDEPYYIDFDSSVFLDKIDNYLKRFTPKFNLDVYLEESIVNGKKCRTFIFKNKDQVKICDRSQLALTFLYLLCENKTQKELYSHKQYNKLITELFDINNSLYNKDYYVNKLDQNQRSINRQIVIAIISRFLNQADPTIQILGEYNSKTFIVHNEYIHRQLKNSRDIFLKRDSKSYLVSRIDIYSIQLLHLLEQLNCIIVIFPENMRIVLPYIEQYNQICQNYKQIKEYFQKLINIQSEDMSENDKYNLLKYLKVLKNQKCNFQLDKINFCEELFKSLMKSKYIHTLELNFISLPNFQINHINIIKEKLPGFSIKKFCFQQDDRGKFFWLNVQFQYNTQTNNLNQNFFYMLFQFRQNLNMTRSLISKVKQSDHPEIKNTEFHLYSMDHIHELINQFIEQTRNYKVKQIKIIQSIDYYNIVFNEEIQKKGLEYLIKQTENYNLYIQIKQETFFEDDHLKKLQQFSNILNKNKNEIFQDYQKAIKYYCINELVQNLLSNSNKQDILKSQSSNIKNQQEDQIIFDIRKFECLQGEKITLYILEILANINKPKKLILKFYNFLFLNQKIWLEIKQTFEKQRHIIKIELVNCEFSFDVFDLLKDVQFVLRDEFEQEEDNKLKYKFHIKSSKGQQDKIGLKILFFKKFKTMNQQTNNNQYEQKSTFQSEIKQQQQQQQYQKHQQNSEDQVQINKDSKGLLNFLLRSQIMKRINLQELQVYDGDQINTLKIESTYKEVVKIEDKEMLSLIVKQIKNNEFHNQFKIKIDQNKFSLQFKKKIKIKYYWDSNEIKILEQFYDLMYFTIKNYKFTGQLNFYIIKDYDSFKLEFNFKSQVKQKNQAKIHSKDNNSKRKKQLKRFQRKQDKQQSNNNHSNDINLDNSNKVQHDSIDTDNIDCDNNELQRIEMFQEFFFCIKQCFKIIFKEQINSDKIIQEIQNNQFFNYLSSFQQDHNFVYQKMNKLIENNRYINFIFEQKVIDDKLLIVLFKGIEQIFQSKNKIYTIHGGKITKQTLLNINQIQNIHQDQQLTFDFYQNEISLFDLKDFIDQIVKDQTPNMLLFQIRKCNKLIKKIFKDKFKNFINVINFITKYEQDFTIEYSPQNQLQNPMNKIIMIFDFKQKQIDDFIKINYVSNKKIQIIKELNQIDIPQPTQNVKQQNTKNKNAKIDNQSSEIQNKNQEMDNQVTQINEDDIFQEFLSKLDLQYQQNTNNNHMQFINSLAINFIKNIQEHISKTDEIINLLSYDDIQRKIQFIES